MRVQYSRMYYDDEAHTTWSKASNHRIL